MLIRRIGTALVHVRSVSTNRLKAGYRMYEYCNYPIVDPSAEFPRKPEGVSEARRSGGDPDHV